MSGSEKERLNLSISKRTKDRLDGVQDLTNAGSAAEVIKYAILTYEAIASRLDQGDVFFVQSQDGNIVPIDFMIDVPGVRRPTSLKLVASS